MKVPERMHLLSKTFFLCFQIALSQKEQSHMAGLGIASASFEGSQGSRALSWLVRRFCFHSDHNPSWPSVLCTMT